MECISNCFEGDEQPADTDQRDVKVGMSRCVGTASIFMGTAAHDASKSFTIVKIVFAHDYPIT